MRGLPWRDATWLIDPSWLRRLPSYIVPGSCGALPWPRFTGHPRDGRPSERPRPELAAPAIGPVPRGGSMSPDFFATHFAFLYSAEGWAALVTLVAMEVILGIDNLIFISILTNKLPPEHREKGPPARHRRGASHAPGSACGNLLDRRHDRAGLHRLRTRLLVARPDPDRRRPVPDLEGDEGDPPHGRSGGSRGRLPRATSSTSRSAARSSRSCCSTWCSRSTRSSPRSA